MSESGELFCKTPTWSYVYRRKNNSFWDQGYTAYSPEEFYIFRRLCEINDQRVNFLQCFCTMSLLSTVTKKKVFTCGSVKNLLFFFFFSSFSSYSFLIKTNSEANVSHRSKTLAFLANMINHVDTWGFFTKIPTKLHVVWSRLINMSYMLKLAH